MSNLTLFRMREYTVFATHCFEDSYNFSTSMSQKEDVRMALLARMNIQLLNSKAYFLTGQHGARRQHLTGCRPSWKQLLE